MKMKKMFVLLITMLLSSCQISSNSEPSSEQISDNISTIESISNSDVLSDDSSLVEQSSMPSSETTEESSSEEVINEYHEVRFVFKNKEYLISVEDNTPLSNYDIFGIVKDSYYDNYLFNFSLYEDSEFSIKYEYTPIIEDTTIYYKNEEEGSFNQETFKLYYQYIDYLYDCDYSQDRMFSRLFKPGIVDENTIIYFDYQIVNHLDITQIKVEYKNSMEYGYFYFPISSNVIITIDTYYGGCIYDPLVIALKKGEDLYLADYGFSKLIDMKTLTMYKDVIENVNQSYVLVPCENGVSSYVFKDYLKEQSKFAFSIWNGFVYKDEIDSLVSVNTGKLQVNRKVYYYKQSSIENKYHVYKVESFEPIFIDKTFEESYELLKVLCGNEIFKNGNLKITLKKDNTYILLIDEEIEEF